MARWDEWKDYKFENGMTLPELSTWFLEGVLQEFIDRAKNIRFMENTVRVADLEFQQKSKEFIDQVIADINAEEAASKTTTCKCAPTEPTMTRITIEPCECKECGEQRAEHQKRCPKPKRK